MVGSPEAEAGEAAEVVGAVDGGEDGDGFDGFGIGDALGGEGESEFGESGWAGEVGAAVVAGYGLHG